MADKQVTENKEVRQDINIFPIEILKEKLQISDSVFAGTVALRGWVSGKAVTESEFKKAVKEFLNTPIR